MGQRALGAYQTIIVKKYNEADAIFISVFKAQFLAALYLEAAPRFPEWWDCPIGLCRLSAKPPRSSVCDARRINVCFPDAVRSFTDKLQLLSEEKRETSARD